MIKKDAELIERVILLMNWSKFKAVLWYTSSNPLLGGPSPSEMVAKGKMAKIVEFLDSAERDRDEV